MPVSPDSTSNVVTLVIAIVSSTGAGVFIREVFAGLRKMSSGVASKETKRKEDIVEARERAERIAKVAESNEAKAKADAELANRAAAIERNNRYLADEVMAKLRVAWINKGLPADELPDRPDYEETLTRAQVAKLIQDAG